MTPHSAAGTGTFLKALEDNAGNVLELITSDNFPSEISPEFLKDAVLDYPSRGGKHLRSALLSWSCGLLGGNPETAKFAAAAVEIYHNWTLVHDDIIDNDDFRRGEPSLHISLANFAKENYTSHHDSGKFGADFAVLAGDIQQGWAADMLMKSAANGVSVKTVMHILQRLQRYVCRLLISGEALDVEFSYRPPENITTEEVEKMLSMKTGVLLEFCAETGALIALDSLYGPETALKDPRPRKLAEFAALAGTAFQLRDDWLGVFGDESKFGKPVLSDIIEGKPTVLLVETLSRISDEEKKFLLSFIGCDSVSQPEAEKIKTLIKKSGAEEIVSCRTDRLLADAKHILAEFADSEFRKLLYAWTDFLASRDI